MSRPFYRELVRYAVFRRRSVRETFEEIVLARVVLAEFHAWRTSLAR